MSDAATPPPTEPPQEPPVEKPKRNWRGWLKEYAVIVIGVLTALAAQQAAEWWQWRGKAAYAADQIQHELEFIMTSAIERTMVKDCIDRRLDELEQKLLASGDKWTPVAPMVAIGGDKWTPVAPAVGISDRRLLQLGPLSNIVPVPLRPWSAIAWTAAVTDTSVTHLGREQLARYADVYSLVERAREQNVKEQENVARLNILFQPVTLSSDRKTELIEVIEQERSLNRQMANRGELWRGVTKELGLDPAKGQDWVIRNSTAYAACQAR